MAICATLIRFDTTIATYTAPIETPHDTPEFAAMAAAVRAHDPEALVLPFCAGGGTRCEGIQLREGIA